MWMSKVTTVFCVMGILTNKTASSKSIMLNAKFNVEEQSF